MGKGAEVGDVHWKRGFAAAALIAKREGGGEISLRGFAGWRHNVGDGELHLGRMSFRGLSLVVQLHFGRTPFRGLTLVVATFRRRVETNTAALEREAESTKKLTHQWAVFGTCKPLGAKTRLTREPVVPLGKTQLVRFVWQNIPKQVGKPKVVNTLSIGDECVW